MTRGRAHETLDAVQIQRMRHAFGQGVTTRQLAARFGVSLGTAQAVVARRGRYADAGRSEPEPNARETISTRALLDMAKSGGR